MLEFERCPGCTGEQRERCDKIAEAFAGDLGTNTIPLVMGVEPENDMARVLGPADTTDLAERDFRTLMSSNNCSLDSYGYNEALAEIAAQSLLNIGLMSEYMIQELRDFRKKNKP